MAELSGRGRILQLQLQNTAADRSARVKAGKQMCAPSVVGGREVVVEFVMENLAEGKERWIALMLVLPAGLIVQEVADALFPCAEADADPEVRTLALRLLVDGELKDAPLARLRASLLAALKNCSAGIAPEPETEARYMAGKHLSKVDGGLAEVRVFCTEGLLRPQDRIVAIPLARELSLAVDAAALLDCFTDVDPRVRYHAVELMGLQKLDAAMTGLFRAGMLTLLLSPAELTHVWVACGDMLSDTDVVYSGWELVKGISEKLNTENPPPEVELAAAEASGHPAVIHYVMGAREAIATTARFKKFM